MGDAATETRTPVCRLRTGLFWPLDDRGTGSPTRIRTKGGRPLAPRAWSFGEMGPPPRECKMLAPGAGFEPASPRLQCGAFTRLASQASEDGASSVVRSLSSDWRKAEESNL